MHKYWLNADMLGVMVNGRHSEDKLMHHKGCLTRHHPRWPATLQMQFCYRALRGHTLVPLKQLKSAGSGTWRWCGVHGEYPTCVLRWTRRTNTVSPAKVNTMEGKSQLRRIKKNDSRTRTDWHNGRPCSSCLEESRRKSQDSRTDTTASARKLSFGPIDDLILPVGFSLTTIVYHIFSVAQNASECMIVYVSM